MPIAPPTYAVRRHDAVDTPPPPMPRCCFATMMRDEFDVPMMPRAPSDEPRRYFAAVDAAATPPLIRYEPPFTPYAAELPAIYAADADVEPRCADAADERRRASCR